jgi:hypothetical protein
MPGFNVAGASAITHGGDKREVTESLDRALHLARLGKNEIQFRFLGARPHML